MISKLSKNAKLVTFTGIMCALILLGGIYLYFRSEPQPIQTIYMLPESREKQASNQPSASHSDQPIPVSRSAQRPSIPEAAENTVEGSETVAQDEGDTVNDDNQETVDYYTTLVERLGTLTAETNEKYPEFAELSGLSLEEIRARYPTYKDLEAITELGAKMREEYKVALSELLSELPAEAREEAFSVLREYFAANVGAEITDEAMADFRTDMGF